MSDQVFTQAYARVRARFSNRTWQNLSPREITDELFKEMRVLDLQYANDDAAPTQLPIAAE